MKSYRAPKRIERNNSGRAWAMKGFPDPVPFSVTAVDLPAQQPA